MGTWSKALGPQEVATVGERAGYRVATGQPGFSSLRAAPKDTYHRMLHPSNCHWGVT